MSDLKKKLWIGKVVATWLVENWRGTGEPCEFRLIHRDPEERPGGPNSVLGPYDSPYFPDFVERFEPDGAGKMRWIRMGWGGDLQRDKPNEVERLLMLGMIQLAQRTGAR